MPISQLDPASALVVIDLQKGLVTMETTPPVSDVIANAAQLARGFREHRRPVVLVHVTGGAPGRTDPGRPRMASSPGWSDLIPELDQQPDDLLITKQRPGAFLGTPLHDLLQARGVTQIVLAGVSTSLGVESTARSAYDLGYNVVFAADAMTDRDPDSHQHAIARIFPRLGETGTTDAILTLLAG